VDSCLLIALSGVLKLTGSPQVLETMTALGVDASSLARVMEVLFRRAVCHPVTFKLGFLACVMLFRGCESPRSYRTMH